MHRKILQMENLESLSIKRLIFINEWAIKEVIYCLSEKFASTRPYIVRLIELFMPYLYSRQFLFYVFLIKFKLSEKHCDRVIKGELRCGFTSLPVGMGRLLGAARGLSCAPQQCFLLRDPLAPRKIVEHKWTTIIIPISTNHQKTEKLRKRNRRF